MQRMSVTAMLGLEMRFEVVVDGIDLGGWASCQGLAVSFNPQPILEGGNYEHEIWLSGRLKYDSVKLVRAMNAQDSPSVMLWLRSKVDDYTGSTAQITLQDARLGTVAAWSLRNVYPKSWSGPTLSATSHNIAVETLELVHEGFL